MEIFSTGRCFFQKIHLKDLITDKKLIERTEIFYSVFKLLKSLFFKYFSLFFL